MGKVLYGVDEFIASVGQYRNIRLGLVTNDVAHTASGVKARVSLLDAGYALVKLFSPEHGLTAHAADGEWVPNKIDAITKLPVISLYGDKLSPSAQDLKDLDAVVFDVPDVGCRFYTYLWTMTHIMETCAAHQKKFIVLDRPNPLTGNLNQVEGPMLDAACASFLARWNIPIRHSCTMGELARYFVANYIPNVELQVVKMKHWNRNDFPNQENWNFIPTSPAIKDAETALLYPGLGLLEGINVNEGRGTEKDFKLFGAPWINSNSLINHLHGLEMPGIAFSTAHYTPEWGIYHREVCNGVAVKITDSQLIQPVKLGIEILRYLIREYPEDCKERLYKTNAHPAGNDHLDKLVGIENSFDTLKKSNRLHSQIEKEQWQNEIEPYLLY